MAAMKNDVTIKQAAEVLGVSHDTVTRWVKLGKVKDFVRVLSLDELHPF